jgi:hypothetical protein
MTFCCVLHFVCCVVTNYETRNKIAVIARQQLCKYTTVLEPSQGKVCMKQWKNLIIGLCILLRVYQSIYLYI